MPHMKLINHRIRDRQFPKHTQHKQQDRHESHRRRVRN